MNPDTPDNRLLDPWRDTEHIKQRMQPGRRDELIIGLGAAWCHKCEALQDAFQSLSQQHQDVAWLWLDIDEHGEFLGSFFPDTLPLLWHYQGGQLLQHGSPPPEYHPPTQTALLQSMTTAPAQPDSDAAQLITYLLS